MSLAWSNYVQILYAMRLGFLGPRIIKKAPYDRILSDNFPRTVFYTSDILGAILIISYSAIFMSAWWFPFPSTSEHLLWRISSIATLLYGFIGCIIAGYWVAVLPRPGVFSNSLRFQERPASSWQALNWFEDQCDKAALRLKEILNLAEEQNKTIADIHPGCGEASTSRHCRLQTTGLPFQTLDWIEKRFRKLAAAIRNNSPDRDPAMEIPLRMWFPVTLLCAIYSTSRLFILAEDVIGLRKLPASAFETVNWSRYIPHI
jgi:hypothetical protein